jgi:hypothetical protein
MIVDASIARLTTSASAAIRPLPHSSIAININGNRRIIDDRYRGRAPACEAQSRPGDSSCAKQFDRACTACYDQAAFATIE